MVISMGLYIPKECGDLVLRTGKGSEVHNVQEMCAILLILDVPLMRFQFVSLVIMANYNDIVYDTHVFILYI